MDGQGGGREVCACFSLHMWAVCVCFHRMELEMQHMQHELEQESRKRQQLEEQLRQQQRHHASSCEYTCTRWWMRTVVEC